MITVQTPKAMGHLIYNLAVVDGGKVVKRFQPKRNLIMDAGLDLLASMPWRDAGNYCRIGTGTDPTKRASGAVTLSRSGTTVTASGSFFIAGDTGRLLKFDSGEECYLTYVNATTATSSISGTVASSPGTIWYVTQTALQTPVKEKAQDAAATVTWDGVTGTMKFSRVYTFSLESGAVNYTEISWSRLTSGGGFFSRDLIAGGGVALTNNQQLVVTADLYVVFSPVLASVPVSATITGIGTVTGFAQMQDVYQWSVNGEPNTPGQAFIMNGSPAALALAGCVMGNGSTNTYPSGANTTNTKLAASIGASTYVAKSFTRSNTFRFTGAVAGLAHTGIRSFGIGNWTGSVLTSQTFRVALDAGSVFDKGAYYQLDLTFVFTWGRTLVN